MNAQIIFSEDLEQQQNGFNNVLRVVNPILFIGMPFLPTTYSFSMVAIASGYNFDKQVKIEISFENPDGEVLYSTGQQVIPLVPNTDNLNLNLDMKNIIFEKEGNYVGKLFLNGEEIARNELTVSIRPNN